MDHMKTSNNWLSPPFEKQTVIHSQALSDVLFIPEGYVAIAAAVHDQPWANALQK